jgi:hypothetical protein
MSAMNSYTGIEAALASVTVPLAPQPKVSPQPQVAREIDRIAVPSNIQAKWEALREAGKEFRGECKKCVHQGYASHGRLGCRNPLVVVPTIDPVSGELVYPERLCSDERSANLDSARCGPNGKLFEAPPPEPFWWPSVFILGGLIAGLFGLIRLLVF